MANTYLDKAIEAVPKLEERISLFTKKLRLAQYADSTIYSYRLKVFQESNYTNLTFSISPTIVKITYNIVSALCYIYDLCVTLHKTSTKNVINPT